MSETKLRDVLEVCPPMVWVTFLLMFLNANMDAEWVVRNFKWEIAVWILAFCGLLFMQVRFFK